MNRKHTGLLFLGAAGLFLVYFFQNHLDFYSLIIRWEMPHNLDYTADYQNMNKIAFIFNKVLRYILNDLFAIAIISGLFPEKKYVRFAFYVMAFGLFVLLPIYIIIYFLQPDGFSSMLSHLHRIIMNPVLMMLLIPAFYYQKSLKNPLHRKTS